MQAGSRILCGLALASGCLGAQAQQYLPPETVNLACPAGTIKVTEKTSPTLTATLSGNTTCGWNASWGGWEWQEEHRTTKDKAGYTQLWDYKRGPTDLIDPTEQVGIWRIVGNGDKSTVNYSYLTGGSYSYNLCRSTTGPTYYYVGPNGIFATTIKTGPGPC